jgi:hypothetical protein
MRALEACIGHAPTPDRRGRFHLLEVPSQFLNNGGTERAREFRSDCRLTRLRRFPKFLREQYSERPRRQCAEQRRVTVQESSQTRVARLSEQVDQYRTAIAGDAYWHLVRKVVRDLAIASGLASGTRLSLRDFR